MHEPLATAASPAVDVDADDTRVLRDVGILRIVHDAPPGAEGDAEQTACRIPGRRLALEGGERTGRDRRRAGASATNGAVALHLEQSSRRRRRSVRRCRARRRSGGGPSARRLVQPRSRRCRTSWRTDIDQSPVRRKGDRPETARSGSVRIAAPPHGIVTRVRLSGCTQASRRRASTRETRRDAPFARRCGRVSHCDRP